MTASEIANLVTAGCGVVLVWVACAGLSTWKKQIAGAAKYECARQLLGSALAVRKAIQRFRNSLIADDEAAEALRDAGYEVGTMSPPEFQEKGSGVVRNARWNRIVTAWTDFEAAVIEWESVIPVSEIADVAKALRDSVTGLREAMHMREDMLQSDIGDADELKRVGAIVAARTEPDEFGSELDARVGRVRDLAKPYIDH